MMCEKIGKWGLCQLYMLSATYENKDAEIHPDDFERLYTSFPGGSYFWCVDVDEDYLVIARQDLNETYRVKPHKFRVLPSPVFTFGERVVDPNHPDKKATICDIGWHGKNQTHLYYVLMNGKKKSKRYFSDELQKV